MSPDWTPLRSALRRLRGAGLDLPFWWRDDDAVTATAALDRLAALSEDTGLPVHLAIIPAHADDTLVASMNGAPLIPVVHGWAHRDHSGGADKKNEFKTPRAEAQAETAQALARMRTLFGAALAPMFVPPWNRIGAEVVQALPAQGYTALSTFGARTPAQAAPDLTQINTHIDPIWWKGSRDLIDTTQLIAQACAHLTARTEGREDAAEPFGLLTHHLVHTDAIWDFASAFIHEVQSGGATPWTMKRDPK